MSREDSTTAVTVHRAGAVVDPHAAEPVLADGGLVVESGIVRQVGPADVVAAGTDADRVVDHGRRWIVPGLVNGHGHLAGPRRRDRLELFLTARPDHVNEDDTHVAARYTALGLLRAGVTTTHHMDYGPWAVAAVEGYRAVGIKVQLCPAALDQYWVLPYDDGNRRLFGRLSPHDRAKLGSRRLGKATEPVDRYLDRWRELRRALAGQPGVEVVLGPDNPVWCSDSALVALRAEGAALHLHVQETATQYAAALAATGESSVERLDRLGVLADDVTLAHLTHVSDADIDVVAASGARVVLNPSSNLRLGSGIPPVGRLAEADVPLGLGVDGAGFLDDLDLWHEIRLACFVRRAQTSPPEPLPVGEALRWAMGSLAPGDPADFVVMDPVTARDGDLLGALVDASDRHAVHEVYIDGRRALSPGPQLDLQLAHDRRHLLPGFDDAVADLLRRAVDECLVASSSRHPDDKDRENTKRKE